MINRLPLRRVVISSGDPAGCGPYVTLKSIAILTHKAYDFFVVGDRYIFERIPLYVKIRHRFNFIDLKTPRIKKVKVGYPCRIGGQAALGYLKMALALSKELKINRLVTAPLSKEAVKLIDSRFRGHTEFLAHYFSIKHVEMMMVSSRLRIILLTRHLPLGNVSSAIKKDSILKTLHLVYDSLRKIFKIQNPRLAITSLNPHAGIHTFLGKEECEILSAIKIFKKPVIGPLPSDTIFADINLKKYDCIICLYHDQGMIPFKLLSFREGVNLTLGLPIIRTSPAHGVAFEVMRRGDIPFHSSMVEAIKLAARLSI